MCVRVGWEVWLGVLRTAGARLDGACVDASGGLRESAGQANQTTGLSAGPNDCLHSGIRLVQARPAVSGAVVCLT